MVGAGLAGIPLGECGATPVPARCLVCVCGRGLFEQLGLLVGIPQRAGKRASCTHAALLERIFVGWHHFSEQAAAALQR